MLLKLPLIKNIYQLNQQANITLALQTTLSAGITIENALEQAIDTTDTIFYRAHLKNIITLVKSGRSFSSALNLNPILPPSAQHLIKVSEHTGKLDDGLKKIGQQLTEQLDLIIENLSSLIEPFIIIFLGGMIGIIIIAMYLPIFQLGSVF